MSPCYQLGSAKYFDLIREKFKSAPSSLVVEGLDINVLEQHSGNYGFLNFNIEFLDSEPPGELGVLFNRKLAKLIAELILDIWEAELVEQIVRTQYYYLNKEEQASVLVRVFNLLVDSEDRFNRTVRWQQVLQQLTDYLCSNNRLIIEGFINFRLKEYREMLEEAVDQAVDDYLMEKEYDEFIRLLRYFVDIQDPKVETINVVLKKSGIFELFDGNNKPIDNDYLEGFIIDFVDNEINYEDLLISALITIAPRRVILHVPDKPQLRDTVKTIKKVFGDRAMDCSGCHLCLEQGQRKK